MISAFGIEHIGKAARPPNFDQTVRQARPIQGNNLRGAGFRQAVRTHTRAVRAGKLVRQL